MLYAFLYPFYRFADLRGSQDAYEHRSFSRCASADPGFAREVDVGSDVHYW